MAAHVRSVDFLPEIFRTKVNQQFLSATLDQLVQEPRLKKIQGFVGRQSGVGVNPFDDFVVEPTSATTNYQLEPGIIFLKEDTNQVEDAITYPGIVDSIRCNRGKVNRHDRLFESELYTWDPFVDFDKFINFSQYYWLPAGPDSVDVYSTEWPLSDEFTITRNTDGFNVSERPGFNPTITLVRGGSYKFLTNQGGHNFYIQAAVGAGVMSYAKNQSSREVFGVSNNGDDIGEIIFNVPEKNAQNFYFTLGDSGAVDLSTNLKFTDINNILLSELVKNHGGIDGITDIDNRTVVFLNRNTGDNLGWYYTDRYDRAIDADGNHVDSEGWDSDQWDKITLIEEQSERYSVWKIKLNYDAAGLNPYISLSIVRSVPNLNKLSVSYGSNRGGLTYYKDAEGYFLRQPLITAPSDLLYYQDSENPDMFGFIKLVEVDKRSQLDVTDIVGKQVYTSPNKVKFTNGLKVQFRNDVIPTSYINKEYYVEGVGSSIVLLPVTDFITPELYVNGEDSAQDGPTGIDYLTINRAAKDKNPWTRSNRWFHIDVITATSVYNKSALVLDNNYRARRPVIEFLPSLKLFNFGTESAGTVSIIDYTQVDALSNINNTTSYTVDGYSVVNGDTIIFAVDTDLAIRNKIYRVDFIDPDNVGPDVINLVEISSVLTDHLVISLNGLTSQSLTYWFNGDTWIKSQQKVSKNQPPLFDIYDSNGNSFSDSTAYTSSTFSGTKLFSYAVGTGAKDPVIEQPLKYYNLNNVGDITFDNNLNVDTFVYVHQSAGNTKNIKDGYVRQYSDRLTYQRLVGWKTALYSSVSRQSFKFAYEGSSLHVDVPVKSDTNIPAVKIFVNGIFVLPTNYVITKNVDSTIIDFVTKPETNAAVEVQVISDVASDTGFYTIPLNLDKNPLGQNLDSLTLGTIRNHYGTICQNLTGLEGTINGANNTRDLANVAAYGELILQQSSPLTIPAIFFKQSNFNFVPSVEYAGREYEKYKMLLVDAMARTDFGYRTTSQILDECVEVVNLGKSESSPFHWSDMIPAGENYTTLTYTVTPITGTSFDTLRSYDLTTANFNAILVYHNDRILLGNGNEFTIATDGNRIDLHIELSVGDIIVVKEYQTTVGNYVPSTPTKLGLYPAYTPAKFLDNTYITPTYVIRGHDGSITTAFDDFRDDVILEFETRIYNNLKVLAKQIPLTYSDVAPGQFRSTDYSLAEINEILSSSFLNWVGDNRLDYKTQTYDYENQFTWNYSSASSKIDGNTLLGNWRGILTHLYDTDSPHIRPWEMLGFSVQPTWWNSVYGPAPYTEGNLVLWGDLESGTVKDPAGYYTIEKYKRAGLVDYIPVDSEGNLKSPFNIVVKNYDRLSLKRSWLFGDHGAVETAWRRSSSWPFAVQRLLALTKPAKYFSLMADRDRYTYNNDLKQYVYDGRHRIDPSLIELYGSGKSKHSYLNWIVDYNRLIGRDGGKELQTLLKNIDVRLCYAVSGFTDKEYLKIFTEKSSPGSENNSLLFPDESYQIVMHQKPTVDQFTWSSVIVQRTDSGYSVYGYSTIQPYFEILRSENVGLYDRFAVGGKTYSVSSKHSNEIVQIPYGHEFTNDKSVVDFLVSYGKLLEAKGMQFDNTSNNITLSWLQMAQEFIYWTQQGWNSGSVINLNPGAKTIKVNRNNLVVEPLSSTTISNTVLDQNKQPLKNTSYSVERVDNEFLLQSLTDSTISHLNIKFTAYEHLLVFDNASIFNDLMFESKSGVRQNRLKVVGYITDGWNGTLDTAGFILNQDNVENWKSNRTYSKGQIVKHKGSYWAAINIIPANEQFSFDQWLPSDYTKISKGLLPNIALKSEQMLTYYDSKNANLEEDADLLGLGLIGFRPRRYMQNLNIDDISQVNVYKEFIRLKGTTQAVGIFGQADFGKEIADYSIHENWAIKRASYGATANRNFVEIRLNSDSLKANPAIIEFVNPQQYSTAHQTVLIDNIWKSSKNINNINIFPTTTSGMPDHQLSTAGYVNSNDVDLSLFDLTDMSSLNSNIDTISDGSIIWVAKDNSYTWNIYRSTQQKAKVLRVRDTLDGRSIITFDSLHNLSKNDKIVIKLFNNLVNAAYLVQEVVDLRNIIVNLRLPANQTEILGVGACFKLLSAKVGQTSDIIDLPYVETITTGDKVWVDNDGSNHWAVYTKTSPFVYGVELQPTANSALDFENARHGTSVAQTSDKTVIFSGAPGYNSDTGAVYIFNQSGPIFQEAAYKLALDGTSGIVGYGQTVVVGDNTWAAVGAPASLSDGSSANQGYVAILKRDNLSREFSNWQLLTVPDGDDNSYEFGYSLALTTDERWLYVGAPGQNKVFTYNLVDIPNQSVQYIANGTTTTFSTVADIIVSNGTQVGVTVNGTEVVYGVNWSWSSGNVVFSVAPITNDVVVISRQRSILPTVSAGQTKFSTSALYTATNIYAFSVYVNGVLKKPYDDYTFNSSSLEIDFVTGLLVSDTLLIRSGQYYQYVSTIDSTIVGSLTVGDRFGQSITTTTDGFGIVIGAPNKTVSGQANGGQAYTVSRSVEKFRVVDPTLLTYSSIFTQQGPISVKYNEQYQNNSAQHTNGTYSASGSTVTFSVPLSLGNVIQVETNNFKLVQTITLEDRGTSLALAKEAHFSQALDMCSKNCSLFVGSPGDSTVNTQGGSVDIFHNQGMLYGTISADVSNSLTLTSGNSLIINGYKVVLSGTTLTSLVSSINSANIPNAQATLTTVDSVTSRITISVINADAAEQFEKLSVCPGIGTIYSSIVFAPYKSVQTIRKTNIADSSNFGSYISVDTNVTSLVVSAPSGNASRQTTLDNNTTKFDDDATKIIDVSNRSGSVYTFDLLPSVNSTIDNPAKFVFGQEIYALNVQDDSKFGLSVDYTTGQLLIGAPEISKLGADDSTLETSIGSVLIFNNPLKTGAWVKEQTQKDSVDTNLINSIFIYHKDTGKTLSKLDYVDPLYGKILGVAKENLDYISAVDPAMYNIGSTNNYGQFWGEEHVGEIWWNTTNCRFVDYHSSDMDYTVRNWGNTFTGSTVEVYQWAESITPPANYTGVGTVLNTSKFVVRSGLLETGIINTKYYFWVKDIASVNTKRNKTLSVKGIAQYIANPKSSGIPFVGAINSTALALYNAQDYIIATDSVLHVEFDEKANDDNVHVEFDIVADGNAESFISDSLYRKLLDSFCGADSLGNKVPDVGLSEANAYGIEFRPRQSLFVNRHTALKNYIKKANSVLIDQLIVESRTFNLLNDEESQPNSASGQWNFKVGTYAELTYQDLSLVSIGYRYLVESDSTRNGLWTIYTVQSDRTLLLTRVQHYDVKHYWNYADWYLPGYNQKTKIAAEVSRFVDLQTLVLTPDGTTIKVISNSNSKWELYQYLSNTWVRVGLESGTIQISESVWDYAVRNFGFDSEVFDAQYFDLEPIHETRQIVRAINEELFVGDLLIHRNSLLMLMFNFIQQEQTMSDWLFKTSLIDVNHNVRSLSKYPTYIEDNQSFVVDYIKEIKPYHVKIREFNLRYEGVELFDGTVTDFDVPAYYDSSVKKFISPILDDRTSPLDEYSSKKTSNNVWSAFPWNSWYENHHLIFDSVAVVNQGSGYTVPPVITVIGDAATPTTLEAVINSTGNVTRIIVLSAGSPYSSRPIVTFTGGNGTGAVASAVMRIDLVRSIKNIIKFDRTDYTTQIVDWKIYTYYAIGSLVRYNNTVWSVNMTVDSQDLYSGTSFVLGSYTEVSPSTLNATDRTFGWYNPTHNQPGRTLAQLISGIDYPGVEVKALDFVDAATIIDTEYSSTFTDSYLGTRSTDINVVGSGFVDTYSSHAPEELVPGAMFDTLDMRVYTRPGCDWLGNGHGWQQHQLTYFYTPGETLDVADVVKYAHGYLVLNLDTQRCLATNVDYTVNWVNKTISISSGASTGHKIGVIGFGIGGGNQLYQNEYTGAAVGNSIILPVKSTEIYELAVLVNGALVSTYTITAYSNHESRVTFTSTYNSTHSIILTVFGYESVQSSYSFPEVSVFTYAGVDSFTINHNLTGSNRINAVIARDGLRIRPPDSAEYFGNGTTTIFNLPKNGETLQSTISNTEVKVYVNNVEKTLTTDFTVSAAAGSSTRYITFITAPLANSRILVAVTTDAGYTFTGSTLTLKTASIVGTSITVMTFRDTSQLYPLTQVFVGPIEHGTTTSVPYDSVDYDDTTSPYDYTLGIVEYINDFDTGRNIVNPERMCVSLNGRRLSPNEEYTVSGSVVTIAGASIGTTDIVSITSITEQIVPTGLAFRIGQDMQGLQSIYRITESNTTSLAQSLSITDDIIYLEDASAVPAPSADLTLHNILGILQVGAEKITYRTRNLSANTVSGLRRGVAGTAVNSHAVGSTVYNTSNGEKLPIEYQRSQQVSMHVGNGTTTVYVTTLEIDTITETPILGNEELAVRVYVGGSLMDESLYSVTTTAPVSITFVDAVDNGVEIKIVVNVGLSMYSVPGTPLQENSNPAAKFLKNTV